MTALPIPIADRSYVGSVTPLKTGGRRDVSITPNDANLPRAFDETDFVTALRRFFAALEAEAHTHQGDPVATTQALARLDALLADIRYVRDSIRDMAAEALQTEKIRRLVIEGVAAVESTTEVKRSEWQHLELLTAMLRQSDLALLSTDDGEVFRGEAAAERLLAWFRPEWKMTAVRTLGLNPDDFCTVATDDDGKPLRTPTVRFHDNRVRRMK